MKPLLVLLSCRRDQENGFNDAIRETWLKSWGDQIDYRFFLGSGATQKFDDEIVLDCDDRYLCLPWKVGLGFQWAIRHGYTHAFKCDTDTYVHIPRLLKSDFARAPYIGKVCRGWFASGGSGYWIGPEILSLIASSYQKYHDAEDLNIAQLARSRGNIYPLNDDRYTLWDHQELNRGAFCEDSNDTISIHLTYSPSTGQYNKDNMYIAHEHGIKA